MAIGVSRPVIPDGRFTGSEGNVASRRCKRLAVSVDLPTAARRRTVVAAVAALLAVAGCTNQGEPSAASVPTKPTSVPSTTVVTTAEDDSVEAEVANAYDAASRAFIHAATEPDPDAPQIAATHTGPMLEQTTDLLRALRRDGRFIRYPSNSQYEIDVQSVEVVDDVARMSVCVVDDGERIERSTGNVIAGGVVTVQWTAAMRRIDGVWRLAERRETARWEGVSGCAAK